MEKCVTNKRIYYTKEMAEDALIEAWSRNNYPEGRGPVAVYQCDDCGNWHWTSRGPMNERLAGELRSGNIHRQQEAYRWERKWR